MNPQAFSSTRTIALGLALFISACNISDEPQVGLGGDNATTNSESSDAGPTDAESGSNSGNNTSVPDSGMTGECTADDTSACLSPASAVVSCDTSSGTAECAYSCQAGSSDLNGDLGTPGGDGCESACVPSGDEVCDGTDNDCNGIVDDGFSVGDTCSVGVGACEAMGVIACSADGMDSDCDAVEGMPGNEVCDGIDNNCDGVIDDGNPGGGGTCDTGALGACSNGIEACVGGEIVCEQTVQPVTEACGGDNTGDGVDNNCDGEVDEGCAACAEGTTRDCYSGPAGTETTGACRRGTQTCTGGTYGACNGEVTPRAELCNNVDDDCDGTTDEDYADKGTPCSVGTGECQSSGSRVCRGDGNGTTCNATAGNPGTESCNGVDDDCDGQTDENLTRACGTNQGICSTGTETCSNGSYGACVGATQPGTESCNGQDDDCDGQTDEGLTQTCGISTGACSTGTRSCSNGSFGSCVGNVGPETETCNNVDDDCDGQVDESITQTCGTNTGACSTGTQTCSNGSFGSCVGSVGPSSEICGDNIDNDCDGLTDERCPTLDECNSAADCPLFGEECCTTGLNQPLECLVPTGQELCIQ